MFLPGLRGNQTRTIMRNWKAVYDRFFSIHLELAELNTLVGGALTKFTSDPTSNLDIKIPDDVDPIAVAKRLYQVCEDLDSTAEGIEDVLEETKKAIGMST